MPLPMPEPIVRTTSREALRLYRGGAVNRVRIAELIAAAGEHGATCAEVEAALDMSHQTASATLRDLQGRRGLPRRIVDSGMRRTTPTGRRAIVWTTLIQPIEVLT